MAEGVCYFNKDALLIKTPKKSPLVFRGTVLLIFAMVCGIYICSICLKQMSHTKTKPLNIKFIDHSCQADNIEQSETPFVHYPNPVTFSREECACNPVRYFAILSMQRSGSGWFETLLNSHINVSSNGEIFSVKDRRINVSSIIITMDKVYNLDWFSSASKNECSAAVGFKWMLNQGLMEHHKDIVDYFNTKGVSVIFLLRRNLVRRMISVAANSYDRNAKLLNGTHKSHVHSPVEAEILAKYKPTINATLLLTQLEQIEKTTTRAVEYLKTTRHIVIYYEDLITIPDQLKDVQEFLRLPLQELTSRQVKIHRRPLSEQVENWNDVLQTLKGTSYEQFLHSDY
ncbi:nodulation protein H-like [Mangifera indica]|uniref:nodulation protein H-like n=1 Tax=Mangifera indica TaxID=29780 RepID=UPI001CFB0C02|nr:nodulation protein H-like [Mangifera indica]